MKKHDREDRDEEPATSRTGYEGSHQSGAEAGKLENRQRPGITTEPVQAAQGQSRHDELKITVMNEVKGAYAHPAGVLHWPGRKQTNDGGAWNCELHHNERGGAESLQKQKNGD